MSRTFKRVLIGLVLTGIGGYLIYFFTVIAYSHSTDWYLNKEYRWIFKDSVQKDVDTMFVYSCVEDRDVYNNFHYKGYNVVVWEFQDLYDCPLSKVSINSNVDLSDEHVSFKAGEVMNSKSDMQIAVKFLFGFKSAMNINTDIYSQIYREIEGSNYKGFYGNINKFSLSNEKNEHQIIVDYAEGKTQTVLFAYTGKRGFFLIVVNSEKPIDENIINIFNLE